MTTKSIIILLFSSIELFSQSNEIDSLEYNGKSYWLYEPTTDEYNNTPFKFYYKYDSSGQYLGKSEKFPREGDWISFYEDNPNQVASTFMIKDSLLTGLSTQYYPNGIKESTYELYKGIENGYVRYWNKQGVLVSEEKYKINTSLFFLSNDRVGEWKEWNDNGDLIKLKRFKEGELHGSQVEYYPNGQILKVSHYDMGVKDGDFSEYHNNGELKFTKHYDKGTVDNDSVLKEFHPNKMLAGSGRTLNGKKSGEWHYYYPNGTKRSKGSYGLDPLYHSHGAIFRSIKIGKWTYWYENGNIKAIVTYNDSGEIINPTYYDPQGHEIDAEKFRALGEEIEK